MRRGPLIAAVAVVVLTALLSVVTNWATEVVGVPSWLANPAVIVLVGVVIVLLLVVAGFVAGRQAESSPTNTPIFTTVAPSLRPPPPGPVFGRADELAALVAPRRDAVLDVVCAGGGTGKTTLARELARRHGPRAFWIDWRNDPEVLATSMVEVARTLGLAQEKVAQAQRTGSSLPDLVWGHLESVRGWLVVVDNVDDIDTLQSGGTRISAYRGWLRPTASGQLLVTTRLQDAELWGPQARLHRIGRLSTADAATVLRNLAPQGGDAAEELAERLGGHPLALRAAGRAVGAATSAWPTFAAYLAALREQRISVLPDAPRDTDPETARRLVGHTWELSLDQLVARPETRLARPLLRALSLLAQAPIPRGLITPALLPEPATETQVNDALAGLDRYGLLEPATPGTVLLHPLVRETSTTFLAREADVEELRERVEGRVTAFVEQTSARERAGWDDARLLVPHVLGLAPLVPADVRSIAEQRILRTRDATEDLTWQLELAGAFDLESEVRHRALEAALLRWGPGDRRVTGARVDLGWALLRIGRVRDAYDEMLAAFDEAQSLHLYEVPFARHGLAVVLQEMGQFDEACRHLTRIRGALSAALGEDHPETLTAMHNLADALSGRGDHEQACALHARTLAARVRVLGPEHPRTLSSSGHLAAALGRSGKHSRAMEIAAETVELGSRLLGAEHPDTLLWQHVLATNRLALGHYAVAVELAGRTLAGRERVLGPDHPDTVRSRTLLADCEQALAAARPLTRLRTRLRR